jgi:hypothetical protein
MPRSCIEFQLRVGDPFAAVDLLNACRQSLQVTMAGPDSDVWSGRSLFGVHDLSKFELSWLTTLPKVSV